MSFQCNNCKQIMSQEQLDQQGHTMLRDGQHIFIKTSNPHCVSCNVGSDVGFRRLN